MPTGRDVYIDVPLSNAAIRYRPEGHIADQLCPVVSVPKQGGGYYIWGLEDAFRVEDSKRAPATEANVIGFTVQSGTYFCKNYALKDRVPWEDIKNADQGFIFNEQSARAERVKDALLLDMEYRVANQVTSGSNVGSYSVTASSWAEKATGGSDPIKDIEVAIANVEDVTGQSPNSIAFGRYAWKKFREHADVIDRIHGNTGQANSARTVKQSNVAALFELERVLVGGAYVDGSQEGQTSSLSQMWFDNVLLYYAPMTPRKDKPSFMYSFRWDAVPGFNMQAQIFQDQKAAADEVQVGYYQEEKITASTLGFLITGVGSDQ